MNINMESEKQNAPLFENPNYEGEKEREVSNILTATAIFGDEAEDISDDSHENDEKCDFINDEKNESSEKGQDQNGSNSSEEVKINVDMPRIIFDLGRDLSFVKLPNFLSIETHPFDADKYEDENDDSETLDEEGRARLKLKVENTIRWRQVLDDEGNIHRESNARMVRWSDGSCSLYLGSEMFDVYRQSFQGDHNHLYIRQGTGLQGLAVFKTKLSFRPHSIDSSTHRKMTLSATDKQQKANGIKILSQIGVDPENERNKQLKIEEGKLKKPSQPKAVPRRKPRSRGKGQSKFREDDEGAIKINAIKKQYKAEIAAIKSSLNSPDESSSDVENKNGRRNYKRRPFLKDSDEENKLADYEKNVSRNIHKYKVYRKAAATIAAHPTRISSGADAKKLPGVGDKISKKIDEFIQTGKLQKLENIHNDKNSQAVNLLTRITGIGPAKAQKLIQEGIFNLDDLRNHKEKLNHHQLLGLKYFDDFEKKIPRAEIQEIEKVITNNIKELDTKYEITICGSYRRGKAESGDIDALVTHPNYTSENFNKRHKDLVLTHIVKKLEKCKLVIDTLSLGDTKFMGVCQLKSDLPARRLDIRFQPYDQYYCSVLYFTGSDIFNQKMRAHAAEQGFTLNEYSLRPIGSTGVPGEPVEIQSEEDIFDVLDYPFKKPEERNS